MFSLQLLGGLSLTGPNGGDRGRATQRKRLALLAVLARAPRRTATRDRLIGLLWPECTDEEARHRLSSAIYDLRQAFGAEALLSRGDDVSLVGVLDVDADRFEAAVADGRWEEAGRLYGGPFLDGVHLDGAEEFERWVDGERDRLDRLRQPVPRAVEAEPVARATGTTPLSAAPREAPAPTLPTRHRVRRPLVTAAALVITALGIGLAASRSAAPDPGSPARIAVFPFRIHGNVPIPNLSQGVVDLLSLDLDGAGDLRVVDPDALLAGLGENTELAAEAARARARELGATHYILGTAQSEAGRLRLRATLYAAASAEIEAQVSADAPPDQLLALVDQLAAALLAERFHTSKDRIAKAGSVSTSSLAALKSWLVGEAEFRRGRYVEAAEAFERATTVDSGFALAHYRHSLATLWGDRPGASTDRHDALALRHAAHLAPRDRQLLEAYAAWRKGDAKQAEYLYRRVLATWPDDVEAWHQLGETLFHYNPLRGRPVDEARPAFERVLSIDVDHRGARWHLALLDGLAGKSAELRRALIQLTETTPPGNSATELGGLLIALTRNPTAPSAAADSAIRGADESTIASLVWRLAVFLGDFAAAEQASRLLLAPERNDYAKYLGHYLLAQLAIANGRLRAGAAEFENLPYVGDGVDTPLARHGTWAHWWATLPKAVLALARDSLSTPDPRFTHESHLSRAYVTAQLSLALGDTMEFQRTLTRLEANSVDTALSRNHARGLRGLLAARSGRYAEALRWLEQATPPVWFGLVVSGSAHGDPLLRFVRAEALLAQGREDEALGWYGSFGEHALRDLVYLAPALFRRGEILERRGRHEESRRHFARVITLWADADPELQPWVAAARARLSRPDGGVRAVNRTAQFTPR